MKFYSTNNKSNLVSFKEAVLKGLADDGGLFMPAEIPALSKEFISSIKDFSFQEISFEAANSFLKDDIPSNDLKNIIEQTINFESPLVSLSNNLNILELFHGPTLAFKDFGARFMAKVMEYLNRDEQSEITILVATSGDTGSAVAQGFYNVEGIKVVLLYPSNKVSAIQEKQLTTIGGNITALEVEGTFDDCQRLVKQAFLDKEITDDKILSSANSINIARLIPQSFYYFNAYKQLEDHSKDIFISVPSGNFGNLTAGSFAQRMGLPVKKFIAAINANDVFQNYLNSGKFSPKPSVKTLSNAMDVGNPSNFARIIDLYNHDHQKIKNDIYGKSFSDEDTKQAMLYVKEKFNYIIDPHGAVGYLALNEFVSENNIEDYNGIIFETAHPAKFKDIVEETIKQKIDLPGALKKSLAKQKQSIKISKDYDDLKSFLLKRNAFI